MRKTSRDPTSTPISSTVPSMANGSTSPVMRAFWPDSSARQVLFEHFGVDEHLGGLAERKHAFGAGALTRVRVDGEHAAVPRRTHERALERGARTIHLGVGRAELGLGDGDVSGTHARQPVQPCTAGLERPRRNRTTRLLRLQRGGVEQAVAVQLRRPPRIGVGVRERGFVALHFRGDEIGIVLFASGSQRREAGACDAAGALASDERRFELGAAPQRGEKLTLDAPSRLHGRAGSRTMAGPASEAGAAMVRTPSFG